MSFEVFHPTRVNVMMGQASLDAAGNVTFNAVDLQGVGVRDAVTIMVDRELKRIAVRQPTSRDPSKRLTFNKSKNAAKINLKSALKNIGIQNKEVVGTRHAVIKDNLIILNFGGK